MIRILSDQVIDHVLDLGELMPVVEDAFVKQGNGAVEVPPRPHLPVGVDQDRDDPIGVALVMPAYIHGADFFATKIVSVHQHNTNRGLPTVQAQIALNDAMTGEPAAYLSGSRITNARTGCIGGLAVRELIDAPVQLGLIGAGEQARWQGRAITTASPVTSILVYSPSDSKQQCATDLTNETGIPAEAADSAIEVVDHSNVIVTATTAQQPVFPGDRVSPGTLIVAIGAYDESMQELDANLLARTRSVLADNPEGVKGIGDIVNTGYDPSHIVPFSTVFTDEISGIHADEILVVESVGSATLDAAVAEYVFHESRLQNLGDELPI